MVSAMAVGIDATLEAMCTEAAAFRRADFNPKAVKRYVCVVLGCLYCRGYTPKIGFSE
jgi:hypothetical protein